MKSSVKTEEILSYFANDGWNADGALDIEHNKRAYEDFKYTVNNNKQHIHTLYNTFTHAEPELTSTSYSLNNISQDSKRQTYNGYEPKPISDTTPASDFSWQPLDEDNGLGFFFKQKHVTPFIGFTAKLTSVKDKDRCDYYAQHEVNTCIVHPYVIHVRYNN